MLSDLNSSVYLSSRLDSRISRVLDNLNFSFLVSISRLVSCLEIQAKMDVLWHEIVIIIFFTKIFRNILSFEAPKTITLPNQEIVIFFNI